MKDIRVNFSPIFGVYDDDKIAKYGNWWEKDIRMRYYFNFEDACSVAGVRKKDFSWKTRSAWDGCYFDALWGYFHPGCYADDDILELLEKKLLADLDENEKQERAKEREQRRTDVLAYLRPHWEKRSLVRYDGAYFGKYDETTIRYIGNLWTGKGMRFYVEVPAVCDLLGKDIEDYNYWYPKVYFDGHQGRFVFHKRFGHQNREDELVQACKKGENLVRIPGLTQANEFLPALVMA